MAITIIMSTPYEVAEYIGKIIDSCRTWEQLTVAYEWGTKVIISRSDNEHPDAGTELALEHIKERFNDKRSTLDNDGSLYVNVRDVPEHAAACRTCNGSGKYRIKQTETQYGYQGFNTAGLCPVCGGSGRVMVSTTVRTTIKPYRDEKND